jgi:hypothetical protein
LKLLKLREKVETNVILKVTITKMTRIYAILKIADYKLE